MNYIFNPSAAGEVELFGSGCGDPSEDITVASIHDRQIFAWLSDRGALHIGRLASGLYDPVCLDQELAIRDPPVVVFDHEDILQGRPKVRRRVIADSLGELLRLR